MFVYNAGVDWNKILALDFLVQTGPLRLVDTALTFPIDVHTNTQVCYNTTMLMQTKQNSAWGSSLYDQPLSNGSILTAENLLCSLCFVEGDDLRIDEGV